MTVIDILLKDLRRPKYSRVSGIYCCNDKECRKEQNRANRKLVAGSRFKAKYGSDALDWFYVAPIRSNLKPSQKGRRRGW